MLNGRSDFMVPFEPNQRMLFEALGTKEKVLKQYNGGHANLVTRAGPDRGNPSVTGQVPQDHPTSAGDAATRRLAQRGLPTTPIDSRPEATLYPADAANAMKKRILLSASVRRLVGQQYDMVARAEHAAIWALKAPCRVRKAICASYAPASSTPYL